MTNTPIPRRAIVAGALTTGATIMGVISDPGRSRADLMYRLADLERQINQLRNARGLESSSVGKGGIRFHSEGGIRIHQGGSILIEDGGGLTIDDDGFITLNEGSDLTVNGGGHVTINNGGDLTVNDGGDIIARNPAGQSVNLSTLAFGKQAASITTQQPRSSETFGDLTTIGPVVPGVLIGSSGRMTVELGCQMQYQIIDGVPGANGGLMGFQISGATSRSLVEAETLHSALIAPFAGGVFHTASIGRSFLVTGLNPGTHTVTAKYRAAVGGQTCEFSNRHLIVEPF